MGTFLPFVSLRAASARYLPQKLPIGKTASETEVRRVVSAERRGFALGGDERTRTSDALHAKQKRPFLGGAPQTL